MTAPLDPTPALDPLDELIASYVQAVDSGQVPDRQELLDRHPNLTDALRAFFADFDRMDRVTAPLRLARELEATGVVDAASRSALSTVRYFGDYELLEEIARGGMGIVFKARQVTLNRYVALKMILAGTFASAREVQRFRAEAEAAANLDHPNIVPIFEVGEHSGQQYYAMKLIEGDSLAKHPRGESRAEVAGLTPVVRAVHHAHQHGVLHRDLKPSNVLVDPGGTWYVTDFGLAKRLSDTNQSLTESGQVVGTPHYMAPEQAAGRKDLTVSADVYSLGVILYERLAGRTPFTGGNVLTLLRQVRETDPPRPSSIRPGLNRDLETIVLKCLDKDPLRRYPSAEALAQDLDCWQSGKPITARPTGNLTRAWKWARRNPAVAGLSASVLLLLVGTAIVSTLAAVRLAASARSQASLARSAQGLYLASQSELVRPRDPGLALILAVEAADRHSGPIVNDAVIAAMEVSHELLTLGGVRGKITALAVSPDGGTAVTADYEDRLEQDFRGNVNGRAQLWDIDTGRMQWSLPHDGTIGVARFTPDGNKLVTYSANLMQSAGGERHYYVPRTETLGDPKVRVWDRRTGRQLVESVEPLEGSFRWENEAGRSMDMRPDGRRVVVTSGVYPGHPPRIVDLDRGTVLALLEGHKAPVLAVAYSPDGRRIATGSADFTARIWDAETGKELRHLDGHEESVHFVAFSPDGRRLVSLGEHTFTPPPGTPRTPPKARPTGRVWDVESGKEVAAMRWPKRQQVAGSAPSAEGEPLGESWIARFSPDGTAIYTLPGEVRFEGAETRYPAVWDAATGAFRHSLKPNGRQTENPSALVISPDGRKVAIGYGDGAIQLLDPSSGPIRTLIGHSGAVPDLAFTPDGLRLISASSTDRSARVWDARTDDEAGFARRVWPDVAGMTFSPDGRTVAVEVRALVANPAQAGGVPDWNCSLQFRTTSDGRVISSHGRPPDSYRRLRFRPDGRSALIPDRAEGLALFEVASGRRLGQFGPKAGEVGGLAFSPDGRTLAVAQDGLYLYNVDDGRELLRIAGAYGGGPMPRSADILFSPDGSMLLTLSDTESAHLWDSRNGRQLAEFKPIDDRSTASTERISEAQFSLDGRLLLTFGDVHVVRIWDLKTKRQAVAIHAPQAIASASLSPDGRRILTTDMDGLAIIWDARTGRESRRIVGHESRIEGRFSPDGRVILTYGTHVLDGSARLWDGHEGRPICTLTRNGVPAYSGEFSPDGRFVVLSFLNDSYQYSTRVWLVDFLAEARARRPRGLTPKERVRFELSTP